MVSADSALDDRDELHPLRAQLVAEEAIDRAPVVLVGGVDRAEDVEFDPVAAESPPAAHHQVKGALAAAIDPIGVVEFARTVDAQADQEVVLLEEGAPLIVEQDAVGLEGVLHALARPAILLDEFDRAPEELELHQRRLATLPCHGHLRRTMRLQQLADVGFERGLRHPVLLVRIERFLGEEEAVGAIDVAGRPARLRQQVEARWAAGRHRRIRHGRFNEVTHNFNLAPHVATPFQKASTCRDGVRRVTSPFTSFLYQRRLLYLLASYFTGTVACMEAIRHALALVQLFLVPRLRLLPIEAERQQTERKAYCPRNQRRRPHRRRRQSQEG